MSNSLHLGKSQPIAGLGTFTYTVTAASAGFITCAVNSTIPRNPGSQLNSAQISPYASALQIVINHNGSAVVTIGGSSQNPTPSQPSMGTSARINAASGDTISVVFSSANAVDNQANSVKSQIDLYSGE